MTSAEPQKPGAIIGLDLTVPDAEAIRDFYASVIGWESEPFDMGGYVDYFMKAPDGETHVAGICHSRGVNADLPPLWLTYVLVEDLEASLQRCTEGGGSLVTPIKGEVGQYRYCVIRDPAGAHLALMEAGGNAPAP
jgi:predicted enzyme related to lactoylglutathione lyase